MVGKKIDAVFVFWLCTGFSENNLPPPHSGNACAIILYSPFMIDVKVREWGQCMCFGYVLVLARIISLSPPPTHSGNACVIIPCPTFVNGIKVNCANITYSGVKVCSFPAKC